MPTRKYLVGEVEKFEIKFLSAKDKLKKEPRKIQE